MVNVEELDPDPYLEAMTLLGIDWKVLKYDLEVDNIEIMMARHKGKVM